ncbi:transcription factor bHLH110-like [Zingiber officinale]|uniref:transcription factor bHLH110-like n=1 Tax=Zingiber officinale TaxID=94328 RepID=UPI001C4DBF57|nr:transcription factor bHLH110-like [Zingiber officinale]
MMGYPNLDHYYHEELHSLPSLATAPDFYDLASNKILLNWSDALSNANGGELSSNQRDRGLNHEASLISSQVIQELGFQYWLVNKEPVVMNQLPHEEHSRQLNLEKVKEELGLQPLPGNLSEGLSFDVYNYMTPATPALGWSSLDMVLPALEQLASGLDHHPQESIPGSFLVHQKMHSLISGITEENRACNSTWERRPSQTPPLRKPRFDQRSPFSPLKVRKEKLGDRIAALQQLVAPFGKTDTASVLMEAIGYIKFLLDQVEKLCGRYMKLSGNKRSRTALQEASNLESLGPKQDLRSRGLCLVPLSCTSYMTSEQGVWPPSNYGGTD